MRNILAALAAIIKGAFSACWHILCLPYEFFCNMFRPNSGPRIQPPQEPQARPTQDDQATNPEHSVAGLEEALAVKSAARALLRGEPAVGLRAPVAAWLASLAPEPRHALAALPSETVATVLAGTTVEGIPAYDDDAWNRTAVIESVKSSLREGRPLGQPPMTTQERQEAFYTSLGLTPSTMDDDATRDAFKAALAARVIIPAHVMSLSPSARVPS